MYVLQPPHLGLYYAGGDPPLHRPEARRPQGGRRPDLQWRVLIIQSRSDKWGFPKGGFERGETAAQCAEREVHEETSFNVRFSDDDLKVKYKDTTFYVKHLQNEPPEIDIQYLKTPGNDCTGIGWIRLTCLKRLVKKVVERQEEPPQAMHFNMGVRKFVKQYMERANARPSA